MTNRRGSEPGNSNPPRDRNPIRARSSSYFSADSSTPAELAEDFLEPDGIPTSLYRPNYFEVNNQPFLNEFTAAETAIEFPTTAEDFINQIINRLHEKHSDPATQSSSFIKLSSSQGTTEDKVFRYHRQREMDASLDKGS
jgi:hypothetical protein